MLYELGSSDNAANLIAELVEDKMVDRLVDFLDQEENTDDNRRVSNGSENKSRESKKRTSVNEN